MSETIRVVARFVGHPEKRDELIGVLERLVEPTRLERGCRQYELLRGTGEPTLLTFVEEWESDAALDEHLASDHVQAAIARLPGLCAGDPDIQRFRLIA